MDYLHPDLTITARAKRITQRIRSLGYEVRGGDHPTRSMANPLTRRVTLRAGALRAGLSDLETCALLGHEMIHVEQQAGGLATRLWWGMRYTGLAVIGVLAVIGAGILSFTSAWAAGVVALAGAALVAYSDRFRLRVEIEAEAVETAIRILHGGRANTHKLGGFRLPYLIVGDPDEITAEIERRAAELVSRPAR